MAEAFDRETAPAKINLALHVRKRRADGYHELETLFAFAKDGDELNVEAAPAISLSLTGPFAQGLAAEADNLVLRAAHRLAQAGGVRAGARMRLTKNLPIASGIGGGSADAAAALRILNRFWRLDWDVARLLPIAEELGADVPACLIGKSCFGSGRGDRLEVIGETELSGAPLLLVNPLKPVSTAEIFRRWDGLDRGAMPQGSDRDILLEGRNDLQPMAVALVPEIADLLAALETQAGEGMARMSGSGATCFAILDSPYKRDQAAQHIARKFPGYWIFPTHVA